MAERFLRGGRLYTLGNGGSSTDAATLASLFSRPARGRAVAAWSLAADEAVVTALGNHVGSELIFKRQIIAHARDRDVAIALSTSGNSEDLMSAITEAKHRGLCTIGFLRPRRWPHGGRRGSRPLLHGAQPEHPPNPGKPRRARLPALVGGAGTHVPYPKRSAHFISRTPAMTAAEREDRVLERIDKFRQRRPRLLEDVVTLAHGAGGKVVGGARRRRVPGGFPQRRARTTRRRRRAAYPVG